MINKSVEVVKYIEKLILDKELKPGDKIPSEVKIAENLGVSRVSVRSGIDKLTAMGLLTKVRGGGTFVSKFQTNDYISSFLPSLMFDEMDYLEMLEMRSALDSLSVELCIKHLNQDIIDQLKELLIQMEAEINNVDFIEMDRKFHLVISQASNNSLIHRINQLIWDVLEKHARNQYSINDNQSRLAEHRIIYETIMNKDVELAKIYSHRHLLRTMNDVKKLQANNRTVE